MATGTINVTTESAQLVTALAIQSLGPLSNYTVMPGLVKSFFTDQFATKGKSVTVPIRGVVAVQDVTPGTAVDPEAQSGSSAVEVVLNKHKTVDFVIENRLLAESAVDYLAGYLRDGLAKLMDSPDADLLTLAQTLSTNSAGVAGATLNQTIIADIQKAFIDNKVPPVDLYNGMLSVIVSPKDNRGMLLDEDMVSAFSLGESQIPGPRRTGEIGRQFGMRFFTDQNVTSAGSSPVTYYNLALHPDALALVTARLAPPMNNAYQYVRLQLNPNQPAIGNNGIEALVTYSDDVSRRGIRVTIDILYGVKILRDALAVKVLS